MAGTAAGRRPSGGAPWEPLPGRRRGPGRCEMCGRAVRINPGGGRRPATCGPACGRSRRAWILRRRRAADPERFRAAERRWREENRELFRERARRWHAANRERSRANSLRWRRRHPERARESSRRSYEKMRRERLARGRGGARPERAAPARRGRPRAPARGGRA